MSKEKDNQLSEMSNKKPPINIPTACACERRSVAMGQLLVQGVVIGVLFSAMTVMATATATATDTDTDTRSLRTAINIFASKYGLADATGHSATGNRQDSGSKVDFDADTLRRKIRNGAASSDKRQEAAFKCHDLVPRPWAQAIIQTTQAIESDLEGSYYHVPRAAFIHKHQPSSLSALSLSAGLHIENMLEPAFTANLHSRCHPQCPVRLRLLPPEPDRLWPRNLVVSECACKETSCTGRGPCQCRQVSTPVLIVRGAPGQQPKYCPEMVPAGCRCIPVRTGHASRFEPFAIT